MSIIDKLGDVSRGVSDKTKSIAETSDLKNKILYEQERIYEIFTDIGKKYYKNPHEDPKVLKELCDDIDQRRRRIKKMEFKLNGIKGRKVCTKCGREVGESMAFCGYCGTKMPENTEDSLFGE